MGESISRLEVSIPRKKNRDRGSGRCSVFASNFVANGAQMVKCTNQPGAKVRWSTSSDMITKELTNAKKKSKKRQAWKWQYHGIVDERGSRLVVVFCGRNETKKLTP